MAAEHALLMEAYPLARGIHTGGGLEPGRGAPTSPPLSPLTILLLLIYKLGIPFQFCVSSIISFISDF